MRKNTSLTFGFCFYLGGEGLAFRGALFGLFATQTNSVGGFAVILNNKARSENSDGFAFFSILTTAEKKAGRHDAQVSPDSEKGRGYF